MKKSYPALRNQGFSLIEILVVVVIIGAVLAWVGSRFLSNSSTEAVTAKSLYDNTKGMGDNWLLITKQCAVTSQVASNPVLATGKTVVDVLATGTSDVAATYTNCYNQAGVRPLVDVLLGADGAQTLAGFPIAVTGGGTSNRDSCQRSCFMAVSMTSMKCRQRLLLTPSDTRFEGQATCGQECLRKSFSNACVEPPGSCCP